LLLATAVGIGWIAAQGFAQTAFSGSFNTTCRAIKKQAAGWFEYIFETRPDRIGLSRDT
jgi:hypothetical protein